MPRTNDTPVLKYNAIPIKVCKEFIDFVDELVEQVEEATGYRPSRNGVLKKFLIHFKGRVVYKNAEFQYRIL